MKNFFFTQIQALSFRGTTRATTRRHKRTATAPVTLNLSAPTNATAKGALAQSRLGKPLDKSSTHAYTPNHNGHTASLLQLLPPYVHDLCFKITTVHKDFTQLLVSFSNAYVASIKTPCFA